MSTLFDPGIFSIVGLAGNILPGAKLYWYAAGTSSPLDTYSDPDLTIPNPNPVLAGADGRLPPIYLLDQSYKLVLTDAVDVVLMVRDGVSSPDAGIKSALGDFTWDSISGVIPLSTIGQIRTTGETVFGEGGWWYIRDPDQTPTAQTQWRRQDAAGVWWKKLDHIKVPFPQATGGTDDGVWYDFDMRYARRFYGGVEANGPQNDEFGYWDDWIEQLGRDPTIDDQGVYAQGGGRFCLGAGNYATALGGHNALAAGVASIAGGAGTIAGSFVASRFFGFISGTTLTVTEMEFGSVAINRPLYGLGSTAGTIVTALGTGTGGAGTYTVDTAQTVGATADTTASSPNLANVVGALVVGQEIGGPGIPRGTTIVSVGSGTAVMSANATATAAAVQLSVILKVGNFAQAEADFIGECAVGLGRNVEAAGQRSLAVGEHARSWARASVSLGRETIARGGLGTVAIGNEVVTSPDDAWSFAAGQYVRMTAAGASAISTGPNPASPSVNAIPGSFGIGMNVLQPTTYWLPGSSGDSFTGKIASRSGWSSLVDNGVTTNVVAGSFRHILDNSSGPRTMARISTLKAGVETNIVEIRDDFIRPAGDNIISGGDASHRFTQLYAATGTINTSDERTKQDIGAIPDEWLDAWGNAQWARFHFKDAVSDKGDAARWHIGLIAQHIRDAFSAHGLDAQEIGLLCYDEWEEETEPVTVLEKRIVSAPQIVPSAIIGPNGKPISKTVMVDYEIEMPVETGETRVVREAGSIWGLRYEECFAMEAAWQRRELTRMHARLAALEAA